MPTTLMARLRRLRRPLTLASALCLSLALLPAGAAAIPSTQSPTGAAGTAPTTLTTHTYAPADYRRQPFVGNGYLGQRIPATGTGYQGDMGGTGWPLYEQRYAGAFAAGFYHHTEDDDEFLAALPTWSTLTLGVGDHTLTPGAPSSTISDYRQSLDMRRATVSTAFTWTPEADRPTDVAFEVLGHRSRAALGMVRARVTPRWSGSLDVRALLDGAGTRRATAEGREAGRGNTFEVTVRAEGTEHRQTEAAALLPAPGTPVSADSAVLPGGDTLAARTTAGRQLTVDVRAGRTYEFVKYVGVDDRADRARRTVRETARTGWSRLLREHEAAWADLWRPRIETSGSPARAATVDSALYSLYSSVRENQQWSLGPSGLSAETYAGQVYWDADTWMFPTLLALHPELARSVVDYRYRTLDQARRNAASVDRKGAVWPWTAGPSGLCSGVGPCVDYQDHLQNEIALAQWQFFQATGDKEWLRERGYPVLKEIAAYWAGRVRRDDQGAYHVDRVSGADEYASHVDDHALTNGGAAVSLRNAATAAKLLGEDAPAEWADIADKLVLLTDADGSHPEYAGYDGRKIKQADTVLLTYPYDLVRGEGAQADLDRYAPVTDPDGPAMTDSVHAVIAAQLGAPGCQTDTYLDRSWRPFAKAPFQQFSEARGDKAGDNAAEPAFTFLTGAGGFLQAFPYGLAGLRWDHEVLRLDPMLTPSLAGGVTLRGLHWQGRRFTVSLGARHTRITLDDGAPLTVRLRDGEQRLSTGRPLTTTTRRPDLAPTDDLARCRTVRADSETAGGYAEAAVDGSGATAWTTAAPQARLTLSLPRASTAATAHLEFGAHRPDSVTLEGLTEQGSWRTLAAAKPSASGSLRLPLSKLHTATYRLTVTATEAGSQVTSLQLRRS
ncbi:glycoside hydrolase family 65 protein [Streptomyces sp. SID14478]|uniref:glycoside hydrolase family 65 protein n=1 Tax=Streptomyces sp. SID14478 TaxID=2706073 RepID=UPI0013DD2263|nr:glycoside hydrolase family 65 protein [Streptomyces sp. SID14478]NEB79167.1 glycoside hydrolase family 65 protein [Streptomyces sp. SID14478]